MSLKLIRLARGAEKPRVPGDLDGLRKALEAALERIEVLEDEVARLRGEKPVDEDAQ
ncbi:MAG: hypothetical protein AAF771_14790 [Pseudomonadota bacterium]